MSKARGPRGLDPDDRALWDEVKKSIKPLQGRRKIEPAPAPAPSLARPKPSTPAPSSAPAPPPKRPPPLAPLDRRARQRLARGAASVDARLDLHGMTLERARARLEQFLAGAQARGVSLALVITGKGGRAGEPGALRRQVPLWLALPELRPLVIGFEEAARTHGGAGALYVRVRRKR